MLSSPSVQKPPALDVPNEKKLRYGNMVQHQSTANPMTTPTSQLPDTMSYFATFTMPQNNDQDDVLPRLRTVPNPNPDSDPSSTSSSSSSSSSSDSSLSDPSDSEDSSLCLILSDKERKKARKTNRRRVKRRKQRAYTKLFDKLCKAAHHHKLKDLRLEGDPKSKQTATILWIETIEYVLRTNNSTADLLDDYPNLPKKIPSTVNKPFGSFLRANVAHHVKNMLNSVNPKDGHGIL